LTNVLDLALRQRKKIRIAAHEGKPFPVLRNGQDVSGADDAAPAASPRPVNDRATRKVPAAADQRDTIPEFEGVALPQLDRRPLPHDPFLVGGVEVDRTAEGSGPFVHRRIKMWM